MACALRRTGVTDSGSWLRIFFIPFMQTVHQHRSALKLAESLRINNHSYPLDWQLYNDQCEPDLIWVTCKAFHVFESTQTLLTRFPQACALLLNNGMGPQQSLKQQFGARVIIGSTTSGALPVSTGQYQQTSFGETQIALDSNHSIQKKLQALIAIPKPPLNIRAVTSIEPVLWQKLMINACINPVTASLQIHNGKLLEVQYRLELEQIIAEINAICRATGRDEIHNGLESVLKVAQFSQNNWSSMAMDIKRGRRTEIDFINGYLLELAQTAQVATPRLQYWYDRMTGQQKSSQS
ncbi:MAG: 2-dehydropantoate 2-reductase [Reinekea sp.]